MQGLDGCAAGAAELTQPNQRAHIAGLTSGHAATPVSTTTRPQLASISEFPRYNACGCGRAAATTRDGDSVSTATRGAMQADFRRQTRISSLFKMNIASQYMRDLSIWPG